MYCVQRNEAGEIVGLFECPQPQPGGGDLCTPDPLPSDHPEVVEFLARLRGAVV